MAIRGILALLLLLSLAGCQETRTLIDMKLCTSPEGYLLDGKAACTRLIESGSLSDADLAIVHYNRGERFMNVRNFHAALTDSTIAIKLAPQFALAHLSRGSALAQVGASESALASLNTAIDLDPSNLLSYNNRANVWIMLGDYERAITDFSVVIRRNPRFAKAYFRRGHTAYILGRFQSALADYEEGQKFSSPNTYVQIWTFLSANRGIELRTENGGSLANFESAKNAKDLEGKSWPEPILKLLRGQINEAELQKASERGNSSTLPNRRCDVAFYSGQHHLIHRRFEKAWERLQSAVALCPPEEGNHHVAQADLKRLEGKW